jgi:hypothetical protein
MARLCTVLAIAFAAAVAAAPLAPADAQQKQRTPSGAQYKSSGSQYKSRPAAGRRQPQVIIRDRSLFGPPPLPPSSTERNYYGPAPGIQPPMERVPLPAPLSPPAIRNP